MRSSRPGGPTVIADLEQGVLLTLIPQLKQAVRLNMLNMPDSPGDINIFEEIRRRLSRGRDLDDSDVVFLGEKELDGHKTVGYRVSVRKADLDATVWADVETKLPVRLEICTGSVTVSMSNIAFNVELDESLFSLEIPEGYEVRELQRDMSEPIEADLIESFRIWAVHMDGGFPSKMDRSAVNEFMQRQQKKMKDKGVEPTVEDITALQQVIIDMTRGFPFVESLGPDADLYYTGASVKFGEADKPILRYRPKGSQTYRIIYGDLSVRDATADQLPK